MVANHKGSEAACGLVERHYRDRAALAAELAEFRAEHGPPTWPDQHVIVHADWCTEGVWCRDRISRCVFDLPIPVELMGRLMDWVDYFERWDPYFGETLTREESAAVCEDFASEGKAIAEDLRRALPGWTVVYTDPRRALAGLFAAPS